MSPGLRVEAAQDDKYWTVVIDDTEVGILTDDPCPVGACWKFSSSPVEVEIWTSADADPLAVARALWPAVAAAHAAIAALDAGGES